MIKRMFDISGSMFGLAVLFVPLICIAICVRVFLGAPIIFRQLRPGLNGVPFEMMKFRSMTQLARLPGVDNFLPDEERLGSFGRFLRATSLDEIPGLWNVLKGEMSLVGPRPLLMDYLPLYSPEEFRRHEVRPGITGWAQINGRNALSWEEKFKLDVWYVDNRTFRLDLKILCLTVRKVLLRDGISAPGEATMSRFVGSSKKERK